MTPVYDLWPARAAYGPVWTGWRVTFAPYRETPVVVTDPFRLPTEARVYLGGARLRREAAA